MVKYSMAMMFLAALLAKYQATRAFSTSAAGFSATPSSASARRADVTSSSFILPESSISSSSFFPVRAFTFFPSSTSSSRLFASTSSSSSSSSSSVDVDVDELNAQIKLKGDEIRQLKEDGISKEDLVPHIEELLALKAQQLPPPPSDPTKNADVAEASPKKKQKQKQPSQKQKKKGPPPPKKKVEEMSESELRLNRLSKVEAMRDAGMEPFEYTYDVTTSAYQLLQNYEGKLEGGEEDLVSDDVAVAGRIMTRRVFGKLAFFTLQDETGTMQLQFDKQRLGDQFKVNTLKKCTRCEFVALSARNQQQSKMFFGLLLLPLESFVGSTTIFLFFLFLP